jgi:hypothetical protein
MKLTPATTEEIQAICDDPKYVSYCSMLFRPGVRAWMTEIEYTRFRPGTLRNDEFHVANMRWPDESPPMIWLIIIFDKSEQQFAESILWKNGLRKVREGFVQKAITSKGVEHFPIKGPNIFLLENHVQGGSNVVYTNNPDKMKAASELEDRQCQVFFDAHEEWLKTPEAAVEIAAYLRIHPDGYNQ